MNTMQDCHTVLLRHLSDDLWAKIRVEAESLIREDSPPRGSIVHSTASALYSFELYTHMAHQQYQGGAGRCTPTLATTLTSCKGSAPKGRAVTACKSPCGFSGSAP